MVDGPIFEIIKWIKKFRCIIASQTGALEDDDQFPCGRFLNIAATNTIICLTLGIPRVVDERWLAMKKTYVKPQVSKKGSVAIISSMSCSRGGSGRSHCLRA